MYFKCFLSSSLKEDISKLTSAWIFFSPVVSPLNEDQHQIGDSWWRCGHFLILSFHYWILTLICLAAHFLLKQLQTQNSIQSVLHYMDTLLHYWKKTVLCDCSRVSFHYWCYWLFCIYFHMLGWLLLCGQVLLDATSVFCQSRLSEEFF